MTGGWRHSEEKQHSPRPTQKAVPQYELSQYVPMLDQQMREQTSATSSLAIAALLTSLQQSLSAPQQPAYPSTCQIPAAASTQRTTRRQWEIMRH